jgi:hypothetical protein
MVRWVGYVILVGELRNAYRILVREPEGNQLVHLDVDVRAIFKWIQKKKGVRVWNKSDSERRPWWSCSYGNKLSCYVKRRGIS